MSAWALAPSGALAMDLAHALKSSAYMEKEIPNTGKEWSAIEVADLQQCASLNTPLEEIAYFLMRTETEVREKAKELDLRIKSLPQ
jgi:hypothetical protein